MFCQHRGRRSRSRLPYAVGLSVIHEFLDAPRCDPQILSASVEASDGFDGMLPIKARAASTMVGVDYTVSQRPFAHGHRLPTPR